MLYREAKRRENLDTHPLYKFTAGRWRDGPPELRPPLKVVADYGLPAVQFPPLIGHGALYVTAKSGQFLCLDAETLEIRWSYPLKVSIASLPPVPPHPGSAALVGERVLLNDGADTVLLDARTGAVAANFAGLKADVLGGVPIEGGYAANTSGQGLVKLDFASGEAQRIRENTSGPHRLSAARNTLYAVCEDRIAAFYAHNGAETWSAPTGGSVSGELLLWQGKVVAGVSPGRVLAVDAATGAQLWQCAIETEFPSNIIPVSDTHLVLVRDLNYWLIDGATGAVAAHRRNAHMTTPSYAVNQFGRARDLLYSTDEAGTLFALEDQTGEVAWQHETGSRFALWVYPVIVLGKLFLLDLKGKLLVYEPGSGPAGSASQPRQKRQPNR